MGLKAQDLLKNEGILTAGPEDSLSSALAKMHSSHDAVFVKDKNKFLGVISLYHTLYRSAQPGSAKVKNCLFSPPKLKPEMPVDQIARLMIESKIYFLPVMTESGQWLGVVSYRRLLRLNRNLDLRAKPRPLISVKDNLSVSQARATMKNRGVSRLVVVNNTGRLAGIVTRYDLNAVLGQPSGGKNRPLNQPVKNFVKKNVVTADRRTPANQLIGLMLDKRIGSVVLVNNQFQPVGLVSVRDCLREISRPPQPAGAIIIQLPPNFRFEIKLKEIVDRWRRQLKYLPLLNFQLRLNHHSNAANLPSGYKVSVQAKPAHQKTVVAKGSGRNWKLALNKGLNRLKKQLGKREVNG